MTGRLIVLDGATGSGKSTLLARVQAGQVPGAAHVAKLTDRPRRSTDNAWEFEFVSEVRPNPSMFTWSTLGHNYAVETRSIEQLLGEGKSPVLVCTDPETQRTLKAQFKTMVLVFIYRPMSSEAFTDLMNERGTSLPDVALRRAEIDEVPADYLRKIAIIDHVLLNVGDVGYLDAQLSALL